MDDDQAAYWAIRLDDGPLDAGDRTALDRWLAEDERRHGSLLRAEAALAYLDRGRALVAPTGRVGGYGLGMVNRRTFLVGGAMSGVAAAGVAGVMLLRPDATEIATAVGEVRRVPLADGSIASINTNSRVTVAMRERRRQVKLDDGEAWFQVAHDKARPFVVEVGDVRVRAVGTAFAVRRRDGGADVLVTEGVVEAWVVGREGDRKRIAAGSKSFIADTAPAIEVVAAADDIDRALAWRTGELALNGESLAYAAAELNRYNQRKIVIADERLARQPLVGYFRTDQPENFARAVADMSGAAVAVEGASIRIDRFPSAPHRQ